MPAKVTVDVEKLVQERNKEYGSAWRDTGFILYESGWAIDKLLHTYPGAFFPWVIILNKLVRALTSPRNKDHWKDIAGYAMLVLEDLERSNENG